MLSFAFHRKCRLGKFALELGRPIDDQEEERSLQAFLYECLKTIRWVFWKRSVQYGAYDRLVYSLAALLELKGIGRKGREESYKYSSRMSLENAG